MPLAERIAGAWSHIQGHLFPWLAAEIGPLTDNHKRLIAVLDVVCIEAHIHMRDGGPGRPLDDRHALARAFIAKAVLNLPTTAALIERLHVDTTLRRLVGWERVAHVPSEATFSRAFAEFAAGSLPERAHAALVRRMLGDHLIGHIARDATAISAREKPEKPEKPKKTAVPKRRRGRPRKGEVVPPKPPSRLDRQLGQTLPQMLAELPTHCSFGIKRNAKGHTTGWIGYKLHIDTADGDIPVSCLLTSASVHDSQVAIPLATITAGRVTNLYDLMDSAYDAPEIRARSLALGHVPVIDANPRRGGKSTAQAEERAQRTVGHRYAQAVRYNQRSSAERVNSALKDNCGGSFVRVRGPAKVFCHLMFGIVVTTVEQLLRLAI